MKASVFSKAVLYHLKWKVQFRRFLDGTGNITDSEVASPKECRFGKWLYSAEITNYASRFEIQEIEKVHIQLHETAKQTYELKLAGNDSAARREFRKMEEASMKLVSLLTAMKKINHN